MPLGVEPSQQISIHALREEGDAQTAQQGSRTTKFQSTPSARRATVRCLCGSVRLYLQPPPSARWATERYQAGQDSVPISIHALREEGDSCFAMLPTFMPDFNPRPPRGGRRFGLGLFGFLIMISIHALREEGDTLRAPCRAAPWQFQSTPSARRATELPEYKSRPWNYFNPRPPRGGRPTAPLACASAI